MTTKPTVTIHCITYNHQRFIKNVIDGFLMQEVDFPIEIIISDDASYDGTSDIIREYASRHKKLITPIIRKKNIGGWRNYRESLSLANGKYIAHCEGDDVWSDRLKLQKQVDFLESNKEIDLVWTDIDIFEENSGLYQRSVFKNETLKRYDVFEDVLLNKPFFSPSTWVFRRDLVSIMLNMKRYYVDGTFPFILDVISKGKIKYLPFVSATYNRQAESASNSQSFLKRHLFSKGVFHIQTEYASKYNVDKQIVNKMKQGYYKSSWIYAFLSEDQNTLKDAKVFYETRNILNKKYILTLYVIKFLEYSLKYNFSKRFMKALVSLTFQLYHYVQAKCLK